VVPLQRRWRLPARALSEGLRLLGQKKERRPSPTRVLMVCMGNICRSPTAEGVLRAKLQQAGLQGRSCARSTRPARMATTKEAPDPRAHRHAAQRGYDLSPARAPWCQGEDFDAL
jgi:protein-tyrosine phosphatase